MMGNVPNSPRLKEDSVTGIVATAEIDIAAPVSAVWNALTDPECIKQYFMGATVETDWQPGSPITWSGEYNGKPFADKGTIIEVQPERLLVLTHFSPMSGQPDAPENYHTITYHLAERDGKTRVSLNQDNNASDDEAEHARATWQSMLEGMKGIVEPAAT
jgi:uncharacterized protein YndB with AHSA1/START domain